MTPHDLKIENYKTTTLSTSIIKASNSCNLKNAMENIVYLLVTYKDS